jgi:glycine/D-amino acid oxidase-like deaminating enzyme
MKGGASARGHLLRDGAFPAPTSESRAEVVIVGGGMAGLSAAWRLAKEGVDFRILELADEAGGNAVGGSGPAGVYPWGAHYVPVAGPDGDLLRELFRDLGVIEGEDAAGKPLYREEYLCGDPEERLFHLGRWEEGILPQSGVEAWEQDQFRECLAVMDGFRRRRGGDGRRAFALPMEMSSRDPDLLALDAIPFAAWAEGRGWRSPRLAWYLDYCCRDDYGAGWREVSAWAGIHYFASRDGIAGNAGAQSLLTWPQGNGWLSERLRAPLAERIRTGAVAYRVENAAEGVEADAFDVASGTAFRIRCRAAVFAAPRFTAPRVVRGAPPGHWAHVSAFTYAPWAVANLELKGALETGEGFPPAWDNVIYGSRSLGYVRAAHQKLARYPGPEMLTWYAALCHTDPKSARAEAQAKPWSAWAETVLADLEPAHPGLRDRIARLDVWLWGHGMIRPVPGFLWGPDRAAAAKPVGAVHFAHSDMSGLSLFEEAQYQGVKAAENAMRSLGRVPRAPWRIA